MTRPLTLISFFVLLLATACGSNRHGPSGEGDSGTPDGGRDGATDGGLADGSADADVDDGGTDLVMLDWSCLGPGQVAPPTEEEAQIFARAQDYIAMAGLDGASIKACNYDDPDCASPVASGTTNSFGVLSITLPLGAVGFFGFFEASLDGYLPTLVHTELPIVTGNDEAGPVAVPMITAQQVNFLGLATGLPIDVSTKGLVGLGALDCGDTYAHHVQFTISSDDEDIQLYYIKNNLPDADATYTDASGFGVFANVPAGQYTVTAKRSDTGETIGAAVVNVRVGALSELFLAPTPDGVAFDPEP